MVWCISSPYFFFLSPLKVSIETFNAFKGRAIKPAIAALRIQGKVQKRPLFRGPGDPGKRPFSAISPEFRSGIRGRLSFFAHSEDPTSIKKGRKAVPSHPSKGEGVQTTQKQGGGRVRFRSILRGYSERTPGRAGRSHRRQAGASKVQTDG